MNPQVQADLDAVYAVLDTLKADLSVVVPQGDVPVPLTFWSGANWVVL